MQRSTLTFSAAAVGAAILLAGCGGSATVERGAAAAESAAAVSEQPAAPTEPAAASESAEPSAVAASSEPSAVASDEPVDPNNPLGLRVAANATNTGDTGSKLCLKNNSSKSVKFTVNSGDRGTISPGGEQCGEGSSMFGNDISASIAVDGMGVMDIQANNPYATAAWVKLIQPVFGQCVHEYLVGKGAATETKDDGLLRYRVVRKTTTAAGSGQMEFELTLSNSDRRSSDGQPVKCS